MLNLSNKAQFFILTAVIIVGVFYTLSKYINPYSFIDTSNTAVSNEIFFFNNVKDKAEKTVKISPQDQLENNLLTYKKYVEKLANDNGYILRFDYIPFDNFVQIEMTLQSQKMTLQSAFNISKPIYTTVTTTTLTLPTTTVPPTG